MNLLFATYIYIVLSIWHELSISRAHCFSVIFHSNIKNQKIFSVGFQFDKKESNITRRLFELYKSQRVEKVSD